MLNTMKFNGRLRKYTKKEHDGIMVITFIVEIIFTQCCDSERSFPQTITFSNVNM